MPSGLLRAGAERQFCCHACETAHHAICGSGLEQYYEHRRAGSHGVLSPARSSGNRYEAYDDPAFADAYGAARPDGLRSTTLALEGLHCAACVWLLERVPSVMPGVVDVRVDFGRSHVTVVHDPRSVSLSKVARFMDRLGYTSHPLRDGSAREARLHHDRSALIRIAVAGALFGNAMVISFALYGAKADGMEPAMRLFLHGVSAVLAGGSVLGPGWVFFRGALASLRVRALHMDVPIALALSVGLIHGVTNTIRGSGEVYFDTLCTLVFLLLIGRWIQQKQQRSASDAIERLFSFCTSAATLVEGDATRVVPIEALRGGDTVEVRAGESVPVDGEVVRGHSTVNNAFLTGESAPIEVMPGETVAAGSVNLSSPIRVRATATGRGTRLGQLMALVAEEARRKAPIVRMADRIAAWFVAVVLALAAATFVFWLSHGVEAAVEHTVALLIITCPCALGLATPLAIVAALGRAAREGVLIKGGDVLESLAGRGTIVLDKTGTLTTGQWRVVEYHGDERLKPLIAAAERGCAHPAARALVGAFGCGEMQGPPVTLRNVVGGGIVAEVGSTELTIGSVRFVRERHPNAAL
ncbi:MAG: heavy metal translocating P-type ATPase, partial [Phycisphaerae bacterium]|nr:heavy metal translocating P-type ATPase [Phycisphaerae bacterium]